MPSLDHSLTAPHPDLAACVIVPCKNEAEELEATLTALANQIDLNGKPFPANRYEVILLVNNSTDNSFALANRFKQTHPGFVLHLADRTFPPRQANVGFVRKLLMDTASGRLSNNPKPFSFIASTDADTQVSTDWLAQNSIEIGRGAGAVAGRILLRSSDVRNLDERTRRIQFWDERYNLLVSWLEDQLDPQIHDPWPRHHQHFGASLAVTPEVYRQVGGLPLRESLEDVAFYYTLFRHDVPFRHSPDVCVYTSARLQGKTMAGLAHQLLGWSKSTSRITVPSVGLWTAIFALRRRLRKSWQTVQAGKNCGPSILENLSADCACKPGQLEEALRDRYFGEAFESLKLWSRLEHRLFGAPPRQPLEEAVHELERQFFATHRPSRSTTATAQSGIAAP